jgi:citrate synthase
MNKDFVYAKQATTQITAEVAAASNPYLTVQQQIYGYELVELMQKRSYTDVLFLLLTGELPTSPQAQLLSQLQIALCNAGPRHPATRAVMTAAISKTRPEHLLPIGLQVLGGERQGALAVAEAWQSLKLYLADTSFEPQHFPLPAGFGQMYGGCEPMQAALLAQLASLPAAGAALRLCGQLQEHWQARQQGILDTGLCAACCLDLGIGKRESIGFFQLLRAPGLLVHAMEQTHKPITDSPLLSDEDYEFQQD